ncbi:MAG: CBS domain-containing protein [Candidatus Binatia bacterium]
MMNSRYDGEKGLKPQSLAQAPTRVGELMTTDVISLRPHHQFREAVDLMARHSFHHLLVVEPDGRLAGVLSDRDILRAEGCYDSESTLIADLMISDPISVQPDTLLSEAVELVLDHRINCLPVVDANRQIRGILTTTDLLRTLRNLQSLLDKQS